MIKELPKQSGLYQPTNEHDACGIGAIVHIEGVKSHQIVKDSLQILMNLEHRGGTGAEDNTGDGAGILVQLPHRFFKGQDLGFEIGEEGDYAVAFLFLSQNDVSRQKGIKIFEEICEQNELEVLGKRLVPTNVRGLGQTAIEAMPYMLQVFVKRPKGIRKGIQFERHLFSVRRQIEKKCLEIEVHKFYFCSFSSRTIIYKGMLKSTQVRDFFLDLLNTEFESAIALVHSRFSTNTFPSWERAHPNRFMIHNGEINTIKGNVDLIKGRESLFQSPVFPDLAKILPVIEKPSSDSAMFDNTLEFLYMNGRSLEEIIMMMIPMPWVLDDKLEDYKKAFYQYHSCMMEAWDGPASVVVTDGCRVVASLDRNGLRPSRSYLTKDGYLILSSETGALELDEARILKKSRLEPGKLLVVDTVQKKLYTDSEIKASVCKAKDYAKMLKGMVFLKEVPLNNFKETHYTKSDLLVRQKAVGFKYDSIDLGIVPMATTGEELLVAMGTDVPLAVLSKDNESLYKYFKQMFAQVTNPPIDSIREAIVTATNVYLGGERNLLMPDESNCQRIALDCPLMSNADMEKLYRLKKEAFKVATIDTTYAFASQTLEQALERLAITATTAVQKGCSILVLSDKGQSKDKATIPALLATSSLNQHLVETNQRTQVSIVVQTADAREIHHYACLLGFGANAIHPYLTYDTIYDAVERGMITLAYEVAVENYIHAAMKGIIKIIAKMGISTIQAYSCARIFEIIGLGEGVCKKYFSGTYSKIGGIEIEDIHQNIIALHLAAYHNPHSPLDSVGTHYLRNGKKEHLYHPLTIYKLQYAVKNNDYQTFKEFAAEIDGMTNNIRNLFDFENTHEISLDEVEPITEIVKRFKTGAMSYGSISKEAHECLAIAMNRIGGKSNTGEGGENEGREVPLENGDDLLSAIKQVASGRFGVTIDYLVKSKEIQIKVAQGAKPGEGGQLPASKVYPWIAKARHSTPGVALISPPPHHDIYSIEDLAQLIYDLKNANQEATISVKLVSENGVGTIASGVAKAGANTILISGYDGGTGASPRTSISNAGMPWELGLADAHQTLIMNDLRQRVKLEVDGKLLTGRDLAVAILLGAEEFGFATAPLVAMGCVMMRVCNKDTCPVGVATQNQELRKNFKGKPEYVVHFMYMIAQNLREYMARLGFRSIDEMIGRSDLLIAKDRHLLKERKINLNLLLANKYVLNKTAVHFESYKVENFENTMDEKLILPLVVPALKERKRVRIDMEIKNTNRALGTILSSYLTKHQDTFSLVEDDIQLYAIGHAGNSCGAFLRTGISLAIQGDANDYLAKGLCGGIISVALDDKSTLEAEQNIIAGNVILYGATSGKVFLDGCVGERFAVRNSGATAVCLGCGDHGLEYMTGGTALLLGAIGKNFAAGMSGGIAYVLDTLENRASVNTTLVDIVDLDQEDTTLVFDLIEEHLRRTKSQYVGKMYQKWSQKSFFKVIPRDYQRMMSLTDKYLEQGMSYDESVLRAFYNQTAQKGR